MNSQALSWDDVVGDARALAGKLSGLGPFKGIVAVSRGGLVPADLMARELSVSVVDTVCVSSYDGRRRGALAVSKKPEAALADAGAGWLVVDDLVDSGETVRAVRAMLPRACYATLYAKPAGADAADVFARAVAQAVWLVFPWEGDDEPG